MITYTDLTKSFIQIGLKKGMYLEVHSSLRSFGEVEGGADTIINVLQEIITLTGAIIMPSFPFSRPFELSKEERQLGLTYKIKMLDPDSKERTGMGIIADTFRHRPDVKTGPGRFRVSAWGAEQEENCQGFSNLHKKDGHALLLGVDIYRLTSMHYVESDLPQAVRNYGNLNPEVLAKYPEDVWYVQARELPIKGWYTIQAQAYEQGFIREMQIGQSKCMFFKVNPVINLYRDALRKDALGLFGLDAN